MSEFVWLLAYGFTMFLAGLVVAVVLDNASLERKISRGFIEQHGKVYRVVPAEVR